MSAISSTYRSSAVSAYQSSQKAPPPKPPEVKSREDSVQLSKEAQAALKAASDADRDGDRR